MPEKRRNELWDDGVHFTHAGYDLMGTLVGNRLIDIITADMKEEEEKEKDDQELEDIPSEPIGLRKQEMK